jgi:hypothetical protein
MGANRTDPNAELLDDLQSITDGAATRAAPELATTALVDAMATTRIRSIETAKTLIHTQITGPKINKQN